MEGTFEKVPSKPPSKLSTHFLKVRTYGSECGNAKKKRFVLPAQHQKVRRVFCGLFNIRLSTPPIGREAALLGRVERVRLCKRCLGGNLSPLISRLRDKLLAVFFPPEGKPSFRCANIANKISGSIRITNINRRPNSCFSFLLYKTERNFEKASPRGEAVATATDEGG